MELVKEHEKLGFTQEEVAKKLGVSQALIVRMEKDDLRGSNRIKNKMVHLYGTTVGSLF